MRKMKLNLEDVTVESFAVMPENTRRGGTVQGQEFDAYGVPIDGDGTNVSCDGTCGKTCHPCNTDDETCSCLASCPCDYADLNAPQLNL